MWVSFFQCQRCWNALNEKNCGVILRIWFILIFSGKIHYKSMVNYCTWNSPLYHQLFYLNHNMPCYMWITKCYSENRELTVCILLSYYQDDLINIWFYKKTNHSVTVRALLSKCWFCNEEKAFLPNIMSALHVPQKWKVQHFARLSKCATVPWWRQTTINCHVICE